MAEITLHSDSLQSYVPIGATMAGHFAVNYSAGEYANEKSQGCFVCLVTLNLDGEQVA
jgi:hypothetical protein